MKPLSTTLNGQPLRLGVALAASCDGCHVWGVGTGDHTGTVAMRYSANVASIVSRRTGGAGGLGNLGKMALLGTLSQPLTGIKTAVGHYKPIGTTRPTGPFCNGAM